MFCQLLVTGTEYTQYMTFVGFEYFGNWVEWLEASSQKVLWEIEASKMLKNIER